jgi:hypothetical protein
MAMRPLSRRGQGGAQGIIGMRHILGNGLLGASLFAALSPTVWAQEASESAEKEGISPAFWIAVSVPIVLGIAMAMRAATAKKKGD